MTLKAFEKCDNDYDWGAYIRIGLYYVKRTGQRTNFCDIHFGWTPTNGIRNGAYSGPKDSVNDITRYERSQSAVARYQDKREVQSDLALTAGGRTTLVYSHRRKAPDVWLFGPLVHEGVPCGSLVAELEGWKAPKEGHKFTNEIDPKTGKEREHSDPKSQRFLVAFPKDYGKHFQPCKLWGSSYSEGVRPKALFHDRIFRHYGASIRVTEYEPTPAKALEFMEALASARAQLWRAFLPMDVTRVEWKIEDYAADQTACQTYARHG
jgi:hypothetical protein